MNVRPSKSSTKTNKINNMNTEVLPLTLRFIETFLLPNMEARDSIYCGVWR